MYNDIFTIGKFTVHGYGLMIAIGGLVALFFSRYRANKKSMDSEFVTDLFFYCLLAGLIGAKILYCLVYFKYFMQNPISFFGSSGFVVYGGIILGVFVGWVMCKKKNYNFLNYFDLVAPSIAIGQGFGRIGCFLAGCCYGKETHSFIGVTFPSGSLAPSGISLLPTQLMSSIGDFAIAIILILWGRKERKSGDIGFLYVFLYSVGRFIIEFFRMDYRGTIWIFSTSQMISIIVVTTLIIYKVFIRKIKK